MRHTYYALMLVFATALCTNSSACNICGCSLSSQSLGLLPQFSRHFVGIQSMFSSSESSHPSLFAGQEHEQARQSYRYVQLWGRYQLSRRFQLFGFVPYVAITNQNEAGKTARNGLGDGTVMLNYAIPLGKKLDDQNTILLGGLGIKAPTGQFDAGLSANENNLPNGQTGTGSWDLLSSINFTHKKDKLGYNIDALYLMSTANHQDYKFGNRLNVSLSGFYWQAIKQWRLVPQAGLRLEYALHDYDKYSQRWLNEQTGGTISFATLGTQLLYKKVGAKIMAYLPLYQHYARGYVQSHNRYECGIFYLF